MKITNRTPNVSYHIENGEHIFDFEDIKKNSDASVELEIEAENLTMTVACGCTVAEKEELQPNLYKVKFKYKNTNLIKPFNKSVTLKFTEKGVKEQETVKLKGNVV